MSEKKPNISPLPLQQNTNRNLYDIAVVDVDTQFNAIIAGDKPQQLQDKPYELSEQLGISIQEIRTVVWWAADSLGPNKMLNYLHEFDYTPAEMIAKLALVQTADDKANWEQKFGDWHRRPSLELRYNQLVTLKQHQEDLQKIYPELELQLMSRPDKKISMFMPGFSANDAHTDRITHPATPLAKKYGGNVGVDARLLQAVRGRITANPQGIDYYSTPYGDLHKHISLFEDDGLCLIGKHPVSLETIDNMQLMTGIDCSGANLAISIALALEGRLRIGDDISFPQTIANAEGDYCSGIKVIAQYTPNGDIPLLWFDLRNAKEVQNCALIINA